MSSRSETEEIRDIENSLKVTSYFDNVLDSIATGQPVKKGMVPNLQEGTRVAMSNETDSLFHIEEGIEGNESLMSVAASMPSADEIPIESLTQSNTSGIPMSAVPAHKSIVLTEGQQTALKKYPALIEVLGSDDGETLVTDILAKVNNIIINKVGKNSKKINKYAEVCIQDRKNLKQYFKGEGWVCCATASGPFRGNEAIQFKLEEDESYILRQKGDDYIDVTSEFNIIHEYAETNDS